MGRNVIESENSYNTISITHAKQAPDQTIHAPVLHIFVQISIRLYYSFMLFDAAVRTRNSDDLRRRPRPLIGIRLVANNRDDDLHTM